MSRTGEVRLAQLPIEELLSTKKSLKRELGEQLESHPQPQEIRIAVLGGSTTSEIVDLMELWLLDSGFHPVFHQSEYGRFEVDAVHDFEAIGQFKPDLVYLHTSVHNLRNFPAACASEADLAACVGRELERFRAIWRSLERNLGCMIVQNNFELPDAAILGNFDAVAAGGRTRFVNEVNREFARAAASDPRMTIQDAAGISARVGLDRWFDPARWFSFKLATSAAASNALAQSFAAICRGLYGRSRKVLVLDLDNTLWGGVIGDDGLEGIRIGRETAVAEAYTAFQEYCLALRQRGVLLAVCSKNDEAVARLGFTHPDSVLRLEHFASFKANWEPKHKTIEAIAAELNLGWESFVFVDDNPAERALVEAQLPGIAVPGVGEDVAAYPAIIEAGRYFEQLSLTSEDTARASLYVRSSEQAKSAGQFESYDAYLESLEMTAEIDRFKPVYLERIAQLTNKTNQFNLTTRRYTFAELEALSRDRDCLCLYGRLSDRFGDHGLVSVVLGRREGDALDIDLWLMSCRVLKRGMEYAMLDALVDSARQLGVRSLRGRYLPTRKNTIVEDLYPALGFARGCENASGDAVFTLDLGSYTRRNGSIRVLQPAPRGV